jgi:hypothetical protein
VTTLLVNFLTTVIIHISFCARRFYSNTFGTEFQWYNYSSALQKVVAHDKVIYVLATAPKV